MTIEDSHSVLRTENLSIGYESRKGNTVVAKGINIALKKGELIGLVGANGIGKSTLLRSLSATQPVLAGSISIKNRKVSDYSVLELAKHMSLVLTEQLLSKNISVFELIALGRQPYTNWLGNLSEADISIVNTAIEHVHLKDLKHRKCHELSDGQLQNVMIARALAQDTELIILDEPTTHLDMYHKVYILKLLQKLTKETQKTILFSSHEIDLAIQLCDSMIVMTSDEVISDSPCHLIEKGVFETLFPPELIAFDAQTGSFKVKK